MDRMLRRVAVYLAATVAAPFSVAGPAVAEPATQVINAAPVGTNGQPSNGYRETPSQGNVVDVSDCTAPSPSAVSAKIYYCSPSAAGAGTCWPSTAGSLLCVDNPWDKSLHRVTYGRALPAVQPTATPDPFALALDDGTHCILRNGGAWGGRADGYIGVYGCGGSGGEDLAVLWMPSHGSGTCMDRSAPAWTVKVGQLRMPDTNLPPPETRVVQTAWFAGG